MEYIVVGFSFTSKQSCRYISSLPHFCPRHSLAAMQIMLYHISIRNNYPFFICDTFRQTNIQNQSCPRDQSKQPPSESQRRSNEGGHPTQQSCTSLPTHLLHQPQQPNQHSPMIHSATLAYPETQIQRSTTTYLSYSSRRPGTRLLGRASAGMTPLSCAALLHSEARLRRLRYATLRTYSMYLSRYFGGYMFWIGERVAKGELYVEARVVNVVAREEKERKGKVATYVSMY